MRILAILFFILGSNVQAQTIEERLPTCIIEAEEVIKRGNAMRDALKVSYENVRVSNVIDIMFFPDAMNLVREVLEQAVSEGALAKDVVTNLEIVGSEWERKIQLTTTMLRENWEDDAAHDARADYIAACVNNFDGKVESQSDRINTLEALNGELQKKLTQSENQLELQENRIARQDDKISSQKDDEIRLRTELITTQRELKKLSKINEQLEVNAQLADVYKEKFSKLLSKSGGATFVEELLSMSAFDRNVAMRDSKFGGPDVQKGGMLGGCVRRLRDQAQASPDCKSILAEFLESEAN